MPPVSSSRNIAVVRMVFCRLIHSTSMLRRRMNSAMASAPVAPTAPASRGRRGARIDRPDHQRR